MNLVERFAVISWRSFCAVVLLLVASTQVAASDWPALFDVVNVPADDVLNVRDAPNVNSPIIGTLAHDATAVELIRQNEDGRWAVVNVGERHGWVSLGYLARPTDIAQSAGPDIRHCFGTEPFWSLSIDPPRVTYSAPGIAPREGLLSSFFASRSHPGRFSETGSFFPGSWGNRNIQLSIRQEICTDGMSDRVYGITVDMLLTRPDLEGDDSMTGLYSGCCTLSPLPGG